MSAVPTAKDRFTALDTLALVRELRALGRARVDKVFDRDRGGWSVTVRVPGEGRKELLLVPGRYGALLSELQEHPDRLTPFATDLRRLLSGAVLERVAEPGGERMLELSLSRADASGELLLVLEMFGTGNLLVVRGGRIAAVAHPRQWAHRSVRVGAEYAPPPRRPDPWTLDESALGSELLRSRTDLASTLAARLSLGGPIAEELIARAGWSPTAPASQEALTLGARLREELAALRQEIGDRPKGYLYLREGVSVDATPYPSRRWETVEGVETVVRSSFSEAAHAYFDTLAVTPPSDEEREAVRRRGELERLLEQQRRAVQELGLRADELRLQAETILAHYAEAERAASALPPEENGEHEVELSGVRVRLDRRRTPRESAQALFEAAKEVQGKLSGARAALAESETRQETPISVGPVARAAGASTARRKVHWFERYRWFISSEGVVVVAGRDAPSNDLLVKRHLKEGDLYVHADIHGAASVVVKHPEAGASAFTEVTIREAAQWAVAFSKAWRVGLASAEAFWVHPDQVSKAGASGEFVARGAWVIHGTKNYLRDLPTELGLGPIEYGGEKLWMAAPEAALRRWGAIRVLVTPGPERDRAEREVALARELGVARSLLQSLLPSGGISVRRP